MLALWMHRNAYLIAGVIVLTLIWAISWLVATQIFGAGVVKWAIGVSILSIPIVYRIFSIARLPRKPYSRQ